MRTAKKRQKDDFARVFVAVRSETKHVLGYYVINAHGVAASEMPPSWAKKAPAHGYIPAAYLSIIGVDQSMQGKGLGRVLMIDALKRMLALADDIGLAVVILDVLEDGDDDRFQRRLQFYERIGFTSLTSRPSRMFFPIKTIRSLFRDA